MAYFDKNYNSWVVDFIYNGERIRYRSKKFKTKKLALEWERNKKIELDSISHCDYTLLELGKQYVQDNKTSFKHSTIAKYESVFKSFDKLGTKKISNITARDINNFKNEMYDNGYKPSYINDILTRISTILKYGVKFYDLKENVASGIKKVQDTTVKELNYYTLEEYNKFYSVIDDLNFKAFFNLLYYGGLRKGEAIALNWNDIDFEHKTVRINKTLSPKKATDRMSPTAPKTKSSNRIISLPDDTIELLKELYEDNKKSWKYFDSQYFIFGSTVPLKETNIDRHNKKYAELAEVKRIKIHDFRHSHASLLINNGANILMVAKRLGHSDVDTTLNIYSHLYKESEDKVLDLLNNL